jgi:SAM-dependent methyltransferase
MTPTEQTRTWESAEAADVWRQGTARREQTVGAATEQMLDAVGLKPGMRVLDIAAGTGDQSLLAARRVGPTGSVLATDISASMLDVAAEAARDAGLANIETQASDAASLELPVDSFDAAISRFGLMFMPDLHDVLIRIRRALKPGARFAALVWATEARNPWMGIPLSVVRDMDRMPAPLPSLARTTSLGEPDMLAHAFSVAGFREVRTSEIDTPRRFASIEEAASAVRMTSPAHSELLRDLNETERKRVYVQVERRLGSYVQADGSCVVPGEAILGVGAK